MGKRLGGYFNIAVCIDLRALLFLLNCRKVCTWLWAPLFSQPLVNFIAQLCLSQGPGSHPFEGPKRRLTAKKLMLLNCGAGEDSRESLGSKKIKLVNPKGNQPWIFTGRTDAEAPILWPPDVKSQLIGKDPDAGKDWVCEEKRVTEDEMVRWHHWLNGHEFEQTPRDKEGEGSLVCCTN